MSTPNFRDMEYNMPMVCGALSDDETECYIEFETAEQLAEEFSNSLTFHDVTIESGHYYGFQFWVEEKYSNYFDLDKSSEYCIDNDDAHYYFDMFRSQALRAADAEKRKIAKWLEKLQEYGFEILVCTAKFSNGEAIYSRATPRTKLIAAAIA